ncbi:cyclin-dependent kinase inhibitor 1Ba [Nelusetta ayraudi]|uniref:cyclin-dependent kinase inhibitor 1Ba n=1 Tax=Nelusetta ayraudi TaxID=303726 RepID=UPI003F7139E7
MSDVGLSNASPTLERVDARQPDAARAPVRRALFGLPDRSEVRRYLNESIQESVREFREEYNFDPVDERPLTPRNYEWEEDDNAPDFYRRPPHGSPGARQRDADSSGEDSRASGAEEEARQPERDGSRKRRSGNSGDRCHGEGPSKRSHSEPDDDEEEPGSGAPRAATAAEQSAAAAEVP